MPLAGVGKAQLRRDHMDGPAERLNPSFRLGAVAVRLAIGLSLSVTSDLALGRLSTLGSAE